MPNVDILKFGRNFQFYGIAGATMHTCIYEKATFTEESSLTETSGCFYSFKK